jgi:hypothetical protein
VTSSPDEPEGAFEYPSLENMPAPSEPYAPVDPPSSVDPPSTYVPPADFTPGVPPPAFPPPYHGGVPYDPYSKPRTTNAQAIAALVASLVGAFACCCGIPSAVGIVLGVTAMNQTKRTGQAGYGLALAGVIVGAIGLVVFLGFWLYILLSPNHEFHWSS